MATASGGACSATAIRGLIKDMIEAETRPAAVGCGDRAPARRARACEVARRTVTKYRQLLRIEPAERRRAAANDAAPPTGQGQRAIAPELGRSAWGALL